VEALAGAESTSRDALIAIRRNAQDWKNLLLRGQDVAERQAMQARFDAQARAYEARLAQLRAQLTPLQLELGRMEALDQERARLFERYRAALARHGVASLEAAAAADREVQGADVATFRTLEQLIEALAARTRAQFQDMRAAIARCGTDATTRPGEGAK
jgi:methyl-accepting chemotaxis protein